METGIVIVQYQGAAERARDGLRYAVLHPNDASGIRNFVVYGNPEGSGAAFFGLKPEQVAVETSMLDNEAQVAGITLDVTVSTLFGSFIGKRPIVLKIHADAPVEGRATSP
jgi:hypothetical protein